MSSQVPRSRPGALEQRWPPVATVLPYAMLAFCVLLDAAIDGKGREALYFDGGLSVLAAAWMLWMFTLHPAWRDSVPRMTVFVTGLLAIGALLVITEHGVRDLHVHHLLLRRAAALAEGASSRWPRWRSWPTCAAAVAEAFNRGLFTAGTTERA